MTFVDTNYFIRFFIADILHQHQRVTALFEQAAQGKVQLFTSTLVFFEVYWVFSSFYEKDKIETIAILRGLLSLSFIKIEERVLLEETVELFEQSSLELEDCYNLAYAQQSEAVDFVTFDGKLQKHVKKRIK
jgi:predicted nucleic acid-binding protein